jgi:hypothetical protein
MRRLIAVPTVSLALAGLAIAGCGITAPQRTRQPERRVTEERRAEERPHFSRQAERERRAEAYGREQAEVEGAGVRAYQEQLCREHRFLGACAGVQGK